MVLYNVDYYDARNKQTEFKSAKKTTNAIK